MQSALRFGALAALVLPLALSSCQSTGKERAAPEGVAAGAAPDAKASEAKERAKARKAEKRAHDLELARRQLEIEELDAQSKQRSTQVALERARRGLEEARLALEHFRGRVLPRKLADARIGLDRATQRKTEAQQELDEMLKTYAKDQFATDTKEIVITRHRKQLEFATRELELAEQEHADLEKVELPKDLREFEEKLRSAEDEVRKAEVEQRKTELENAVELAKVRFEIHELEQPADDEKGGEK